MAESCAKIEELLSAYLDGRLSPEDAAGVAAHLERCPTCAALLEKMRRVDDIASSAVNDIDASVLDTLEQRIRADVDRLPTVNIEAEPKAKKVMPVWYRYVAVAASLVLVFMIGRAFYKSGGLDQWLPYGKGKTVETGRPPMQSAQPPAAEHVAPAMVPPSQPSGQPEIDQSETVPPEPARTTKKTLPQEAVPTPTKSMPVQPPTTQASRQKTSPPPTEDVRITTRDELTDAGRDRDAARGENAEIGKSIVAPGPKEQPAGTTASGSVSRKMDFAPGGVQQLSIDVKGEGDAGAKDTASTATSESKREKETADALSTIEQKAGQLKQQAAEEMGKLGYNNLVASPPLPKISGGTLQSRYTTALTQYSPARGMGKVQMVIRKEHDSTAAVRFVLGQADNTPESTDLESQATKLYLTMRAAGDLYRFTGETSYFDRAVEAREALLRFLDTFAKDPAIAKTAEAYRTELQATTLRK